MTILFIGILVFLAHFFTALFEKTKVPDVLLLIILGILIGPIFNLVSLEDFGKVGPVLTTIALIVILFEEGTALNFLTILKSSFLTLSLTFATFFVTLFLGALFFILFFSSSITTGLLFGSIIAGTSPAVIIPIVKGLKLKDPMGTVLIMESSLADVLCIVFSFSFLKALIYNEIEPSKILLSLIYSFSFGILIGMMGALIWMILLKRIRNFPNAIFTNIAFLFIIYGVAEALHFNGVIASLSFGIMLTNFHFLGLDKLPLFKSLDWEKINEIEQIFFREVVFLLKIFFFIYLGISISFFGLKLILYGILVTLSIYIMRFFITKIFINKNIGWYEKSITSLMVPKGLAAAVLTGIPIQYGIKEGSTIQNFTFIVILLSILFTAIMVPLVHKIKIFKYFFSTKL